MVDNRVGLVCALLHLAKGNLVALMSTTKKGMGEAVRAAGGLDKAVKILTEPDACRAHLLELLITPQERGALARRTKRLGGMGPRSSRRTPGAGM